MTAQPLTREQAIDAAGKALAEVSRELRRTRRVKAQLPATQQVVAQEQDNAAA